MKWNFYTRIGKGWKVCPLLFDPSTNGILTVEHFLTPFSFCSFWAKHFGAIEWHKSLDDPFSSFTIIFQRKNAKLDNGREERNKQTADEKEVKTPAPALYIQGEEQLILLWREQHPTSHAPTTREEEIRYRHLQPQQGRDGNLQPPSNQQEAKNKEKKKK